MDVYAPQDGTTSVSEETKIEMERRVREAANYPDADVHIGKYFCTVCKNWLDATRQVWSYGTCLSCSLDRATEISDFFHEQEEE